MSMRFCGKNVPTSWHGALAKLIAHDLIDQGEVHRRRVEVEAIERLGEEPQRLIKQGQGVLLAR
jgi:hypothetical protein